MAETQTYQSAFRDSIYKVGVDGNLQDLHEFYEGNAQEYDQFCTDAKKEVGAQALINAVVNAVPDKNARILDALAGTGLAGVQLKKSGFTNVDALDYSQKMLNIAKDRGIYQTYICDVIKANGNSQVPDNTYDAVVINGSFTPGHLNVGLIPELLRMVKKDGIVAFNVAQRCYVGYTEFSGENFKNNLDSFISQGLLSKWEMHNCPYNKTENCNVYLLRL